MTTYCLDPNATFIAHYTINTGTMPTNNVVFSELSADLSASATTLTVKSWEWSLFTMWMVATIEQLNAEKEATAREVVLISWISWNTLTIVRGYEKCVADDTASPKELDNTPLAFTSWARISVYVSRALLNGVQTRLQQVNCPCNTQVYNDTMATTNCVLNCCDAWRDKLLSTKACCCYNDKWFGSGCDWDCVITEDTFLCACKEYEFNNLTINQWVLVRFEWAGTPTIRVKRKFCNMWTIDLRWWTFVWACSETDVYTSTVIANNSDCASYNAMCFGCWWAGWWGCAWWNATTGQWWDWWNATNGCYSVAPTCHDWFNGWNGAEWESCARNNRQCHSWWWGWWRYTWNWGNWWYWSSWSTSDNYSMDWWQWWAGGNGWIWWRWWDWGHWGNGYASAPSWNWWNGYIGWDGWDVSWGRDCMHRWGTGNWWNWIIQWWKWWGSFKTWSRWWQWGNAINNMYGFRLYACEVWNCIICAKWWIWWAGGCNTMPASYTSWGWNWGCWANGWKVFIWYFRWIIEGTVDVSWWQWGCGWAACGSWNAGSPWADWTAGVKTICKIM